MVYRYSSTQFILAFGISILFLAAVSVRLPQLFAAVLVHAALAGLGATFQGVIRMVSLDLIGVPQGTSVDTVVAISSFESPISPFHHPSHQKGCPVCPR